MAKRLACSALFCAFAVILSYIEYLFPVIAAIPGVKLGLANFAVLLALYHIGAREALLINTARILIMGMLFGNVMSIIFAAAGAALSFLVMYFLKKSGLFGMIAVSGAGGVAHNAGQMIAAMIFSGTAAVAAYFPVLIISGLVTGIVIGILARLLGRRIAKILSLSED